MNWEYFNIAGYLSVLLWIVVPVLWVIQMKAGTGRRLCEIALVLAVAAYVLAEINSFTHVNRIELDRSEQMAEWEARQEAARQAALDSRGEEVAQIRFAEDGANEFMDKAGMDEADLKYMEKLEEDSVPDWKKQKKDRSGEGALDDGLESMLGGGETTEGVESESLEQEIKEPSAVMVEADMMMANRLDALNLDATFYAVLLALLMVVIDYLRRANIYAHASAPLPLPSPWIDALTPRPAVVERPDPPRRSVPEELAWMTKRGDAFLYLTDNRTRAAEIPASMPLFAKSIGRIDVLRAGGSGEDLDDEFIFESLWFRRSSFVVDSAARAERMLASFLVLLKERQVTRARVRQTVHVVWDSREPMPDTLRREFTRLATPAGFSLFVCPNHRSN